MRVGRRIFRGVYQQHGPLHDDPFSYAIIGLAIKVHKALGPGLFEAIYEAALELELREAGYRVGRQVELPVYYRGRLLSEHGYRVDLLIDDSLIIELKSVKSLLPIHRAQILSYMRLSDVRKGLLINFNNATLTEGVERYAL